MSKEATVFVLDLGSTMGECHSGRIETDLDYGLRYVYDKMADYMSSTRTTLNIGVIGFRTDETSNPLGDGEEGYENISVLRPLGALALEQFQQLRAQIRPSQTEAGDAISAAVVAAHLIEKFTTLKTGKLGSYVRKIILLTDGQGRMDDDETNLNEIIAQFKRIGIHLTVVGLDFDDPEFGFKEEDKSLIKKSNEDLLRGFVEKLDNGSLFATAAEVIESLSEPKIKEVRAVPLYQGRLTLGDPEKYPDTAMSIDVKRIYRTKIAAAPSASSVVNQISAANGGASAQSSHTLAGDVEMTDAPAGELSSVRTAYAYKVQVSGGIEEKHVERENLDKGYMYGRTAVPISESERNVTDFETVKSFSIIGFIPNDKYEQYLTMTGSCITIAEQVNDKSRLALSSLAHAMYELESYAVARLVTKDSKEPQIVLLAPFIEPDLEGLIDVQLPFAEDIRTYRFPPLDRVITASGVVVHEHRYLPSNELDAAMSDYVDSMDLSTFGKDEEGEPAEYMKIDETFSPIVHRIKQAIRHRAIYDGPVGPPAEVLTKWSEPPAQLLARSSAQLNKLVDVADVKKVPPKAKGKRGRREAVTPLSGLDIDALLKKNKPKTVSKEHAISDFNRMLLEPESDEVVFEAVNQMSDIILDLLKTVGDGGDQRAQENIKVMREAMVDFEFPDHYNNFMKDLKKRILKQEFGDRREFMRNLNHAKLGLIDTNDLAVADVSPEEAAEFFSLTTQLPTRSRED